MGARSLTTMLGCGLAKRWARLLDDTVAAPDHELESVWHLVPTIKRGIEGEWVRRCNGGTVATKGQGGGDQSGLLTLEDMATLIKKHPNTVGAYAAEGAFGNDAFKVGREWRFYPRAVETLKERLNQRPDKPVPNEPEPNE